MGRVARKRVSARVLAAVLALCAWQGSSCGQPRPAPLVQSCPDGPRAVGDGRLDRALGEIKRQSPHLQFQLDDAPCLHAKATVKALARTVRKDYLTSLTGYEFLKIVNGDGYLLVERFRSSSPQALDQLRDALLAREPRSLAGEAATRYDVFVSGGDLILMVSSATGYEANVKLIGEIRRVY